MKKIILYVLSVCMLLGSAVTVRADQIESNQEVETSSQEKAAEVELECVLSNPEVITDKGKTLYKTTLSILNSESVQGYQIQVTGEQEDSILIEDKMGGAVTPAVYKDGKLNFAVMAGESVSGKQEICEITSSYPFSDKNKEREIKVDELQVVTNVAIEEIKTLGPIILSLPYIAPPFYATFTFYLVVGGILLLAVGSAVIWMRKKRKGMKSSVKEAMPQII